MEEAKELESESISEETCPVCSEKELTLTETVLDIPYFGVAHLLAMNCSKCGYKASDIEAEEEKDPVKFKFKVESEDDLNVRVVKSGQATVKFSRMGSMEPGEISTGFVSNIEGLINRFKNVIEGMKDEAENKKEKNKAKNYLKKLNRVLWGRDSLTIKIEDPSGNSAILSDKAEKSKL